MQGTSQRTNNDIVCAHTKAYNSIKTPVWGLRIPCAQTSQKRSTVKTFRNALAMVKYKIHTHTQKKRRWKYDVNPFSSAKEVKYRRPFLVTIKGYTHAPHIKNQGRLLTALLDAIRNKYTMRVPFQRNKTHLLRLPRRALPEGAAPALF